MKEILIEALRSAGEIHLRHYQAVKHIEIKENFTSIVTEADLESEKRIIEVIEKHCPGHNILSEEKGFTNRKSAFTWVIDPIDGTSNYAAGLPWFGSLVALSRTGSLSSQELTCRYRICFTWPNITRGQLLMGMY